MSLSIHTNKAAMENTQQLTKLATQRTDNQNAIATAKTINSFKDSAAAMSIATKMSGEARAYEAAQVAQGVAEAAVGVSMAAGEKVSALVSEARAQSVLAQTGGLSDADRQAIQGNVDSLMTQVDQVVSTASFNDVNLVDSVDGQAGQTFSTIANPEGDTLEVVGPAMDRAALGLTGLDVTTDPAAAFAAFDSALGQVTSGMAELGAFANQLEGNQTQLSNQADQIAQGIGVMVDANMAQEAARKSSLDIRTQLQTTTASIANAAPSVVGQLF